MLKGIISKICLSLFACLLSLSVFAAKVNINDADVEILATGLTGVGPKIAQRIVDYRNANGPFSSIEQLTEVKGIGIKIIEKNRDELSIEATSQ